ncbi:hypothetical protein QBC47DRAFT_174436 [Echria macrotheca]|uniref:Uncharacterized protein n=1 Tax=Echria macrotheca TaxID=438768 RepID=A0AAJ0F6M4_9PEZI|nr:hypothetical protein QBC47DRAFT_174436 [Echria macrotheca]
MAEVAAGALIAEQVVATGIETAAVVAVASPTQPLKFSLSQLSKVASTNTSANSLARSNHTLTSIGDKTYMFGGEGPDGKLCPTDVHIITLPIKKPTDIKHHEYPPFPLQDAETGRTLIPTPRSQHAACARDKYLIVHGGRDTQGKPIEEENCLWLWDTEKLVWTRLHSETQIGKAMTPRFGHSIFVDEQQDFLVLHGGHAPSELQHKLVHDVDAPLSNPDLPTETETWLFDFTSDSWTALPRAPAPPVAAAYVDTTLYTISRTDSPFSVVVNYLHLLHSPTEREKPGALVWKTLSMPTNPLTPGPRPRDGGALVPLNLGHGRQYLIYMFGCDEPKPDHPESAGFYSDIWSLQLPSHGLSAAKLKDKIRETLPGLDSGELSWAEVELVAAEQMVPEGKVHPGPRAFFGADSCLDGKGVVLWGGVNAKGEREDDGWVLSLAYGHADNDRWE